jgi:hypothetical protein
MAHRGAEEGRQGMTGPSFSRERTNPPKPAQGRTTAHASQREGQARWLAGDIVFLFVFYTMPQKNILLICN